MDQFVSRKSKPSRLSCEPIPCYLSCTFQSLQKLREKMQLAVLIMGLVCRLVGCTTISPREVTSSPITSQVTSSEPHYNSNDVINGTHGISRAKPVPFREDVVTTSAPTTSSLMVESQMEGLVFPRVIPAGIVESGLNASQVVVPGIHKKTNENLSKSVFHNFSLPLSLSFFCRLRCRQGGDIFEISSLNARNFRFSLGTPK